MLYGFVRLQACGVADHQRTAQLGLQYGAPLASDSGKYRHDGGVGAVRSAARALLSRHGKVRRGPGSRQAGS